MYNLFKSAGVALITPFHKDGSIDFKSLERLIEFQIEKNIGYFVLLGTTGESVTLNKDEKYALQNFAVEIINKRKPIVIGIGGNNTQEVLNCINSANFDSINAILSVCPSYNKPSQNGIFQHYKYISNASPIPVILYNVPGRTGINIKAETTLKIANELKNIIGIKEASGNLGQIMEIINNKPENFLVISGDDALTLPTMAIGGDGVISVIANAYPKEFSKLIQLCLENKFSEAQTIHYKLLDIINAIFLEGSPAGIKAVLEIMKLSSNNLRLPLVPVGKTTYNLISKLIQNQ
jgi:4-hydroxy-tetrahydrodipicolinate synthase